MTIIEQLQWRYATKKFDVTRHLSADKLQTLKEAFNLTALSYGLQTIKLVVIEDKTKREALVKHSYDQRQVADASHLLILCVQNSIDNTDVDAHFENIRAIRNTPDSILEPFKTEMKTAIETMPKAKKNRLGKTPSVYCVGQFNDSLCNRKNRQLSYGGF